MKSIGVSLFKSHENRVQRMGAAGDIYISCTNFWRFFRQFGSLTDPGGTFKVYGTLQLDSHFGPGRPLCRYRSRIGAFFVLRVSSGPGEPV